MHFRRQPLQVTDATVVRQVHLPGFTRQDPVDRLVRLDRIELHRRGRWKDNLANRRVELAIGDAKAVAREHAPGLRIFEDVVVPRMALGMDCLQRPSAQLEPLLVIRNIYTPRIDGYDNAIDLLRFLFSIHGLRAGNKPHRVDHVWGAVWMQYAARVG